MTSRTDKGQVREGIPDRGDSFWMGDIMEVETPQVCGERKESGKISLEKQPNLGVNFKEH